MRSQIFVISFSFVILCVALPIESSCSNRLLQHAGPEESGSSKSLSACEEQSGQSQSLILHCSRMSPVPGRGGEAADRTDDSGMEI